MLRYCNSCVMPETKPDLDFDGSGVCSACRYYEKRRDIDWERRSIELDDILGRYRSKVQGVSGTVAFKLADEAETEQVQVADGVQHLVLDEFILVPKTVLVDDPVVVNNDGIVDTATKGKVLRPQVFEVPHEPEGARPAYFLDERRG